MLLGNRSHAAQDSDFVLGLFGRLVRDRHYGPPVPVQSVRGQGAVRLSTHARNIGRKAGIAGPMRSYVATPGSAREPTGSRTSARSDARCFSSTPCRFAEAARAATCSAGMSCVRLPSVLMHARSCISIVFLFRRRLERYASRVAGPANCERRTGSSLSATSTGL